MNIDELVKADPSIATFIQKFVSDPRFLQVKDAFVSHTPAGAENETSVEVNHGKFLGTRHVFNKMEEVSRETKLAEATKKQRPVKTGEKDADMDD